MRGAAFVSTGLEQLTADHAVVKPLPGPFATVQGRIADAVLETPVSIRGVPVAALRQLVARVALGPDARFEDIDLTTRTALDCRTRARAGCGHAMAHMALLEKLDAVDVPTIVIAGGRDVMTPISHAERIETALPHSLGLRVDPRAGHMTPLESPELVNEALRELAAATPPARPRAGSRPERLSPLPRRTARNAASKRMRQGLGKGKVRVRSPLTPTSQPSITRSRG